MGKSATPPSTPSKSLTVEQIVQEGKRSKEMPTGLAWSPDGKRLGFIRTISTDPKVIRGTVIPGVTTSEIWSLDTAGGEEHLLVSRAQLAAAFSMEHRSTIPGSEDESEVKRHLLQSYVWAPSGHALLLATGYSIVWYDLDAHSSKPLVTDKKDLSSLRISPDGHFVSFIQDHTLWLADAATGALHPFTRAGTDDLLEGEPDWVYDHELGMHAAYWWSPNASSIAWIETDDHAVEKYVLRSSGGEDESIAYPTPGKVIPTIHLFIQSILTKKPLSIDLGSNPDVYIPLVQWLPDGKHLAIERLSRDQKSLELLIADASTGKATTILTEKDAYWINLSSDLHFLSDSHRFLWSSERTGYRHLYLYDIAGHQIAQLTHGDWEVTSLAGIDEAAGMVYFSATEASPAERPLYRVHLDGSGFARVTQDKGTHETLFAPAGTMFLDTWSDHATLPRQELLRTDGSKIGSIHGHVPDNLSADQLSSVEYFTFKTHMGTSLKAWMMKPPDFDPTHKYPVILYAAGGPGEQIVRDKWGGDISLWFSLMTQKGYIVFAVDNRGSAGYGHFFEEPIHLRFSGMEMGDLRDGVFYLRAQSWVDGARIGICGWGYGGFLALHGMLDPPLLYKAAFAGSPYTDWHLDDAVFAERYLESPVQNQDGWLASNPAENAQNLSGPLLLAQGTLDEKIHVENSLTLLDELLDTGKYADILLFADRKDLFEEPGQRRILFQRLTAFFTGNL